MSKNGLNVFLYMLSINMLFAHRLQDFYTGGEREAMADEISNLRDQVEKESCVFLSSI
jgi:hypothetical protein